METKKIKDKELKVAVEKLMKQLGESLVLIFFEGQDAVLLYKHYRYINPVEEAQRVYFGKFKKPSYLHQIKPNTFYFYGKIN